MIGHAREQRSNAGRSDGNPREIVIEIAGKTQAKMHELMDEANDMLEGLVRYRIMKVEREFLEASRIVRD